MTDRDLGNRFEEDPNLHRLLGKNSLDYLSKLQERAIFKRISKNAYLQYGDIEIMPETQAKHAIWFREFTQKIFDAKTLSEIDSILEPWLNWSKLHGDAWKTYWASDVDNSFEETQKYLNQLPIPKEIKSQQGILTDNDLLFLADDLLNIVRNVDDVINLLESKSRPASLYTILRIQDWLKISVTPTEGLDPYFLDKPDIGMVDENGESYLTLTEEGQNYVSSTPDKSTWQEWMRWNELEVGTHISYLMYHLDTRKFSIETGTVQGFNILGEEDGVVFSPHVADISMIVVNEKTGFYECPWVRDIRLDNEEFTTDDLFIKEQSQVIDIVVVDLFEQNEHVYPTARQTKDMITFSKN